MGVECVSRLVNVSIGKMAEKKLMPKSQYDAIIFSLYAVGALTTLLRLYCRGFVLRALGADDALITCAIVSSILRSYRTFLNIADLTDSDRYWEQQPSHSIIRSCSIFTNSTPF